jgi:hypothetical protein
MTVFPISLSAGTAAIPQLPHFGDLTFAPPIEFTHKFPLSHTVHNYFHKFPHPSHPEVKEIKVVEEKTDRMTGIVYRKRNMTIQLEGFAPWWVVNLLGFKEAHFQEESHYDPKSNVFSLATRNITCSNFILAAEYSKFEQHPTNPQWTSFVQKGGIKTYGLPGLIKGKFEEFVAHRATEGGLDSCMILEDKLQQVYGSSSI